MEDLDKKLLVVLRDGSKILGTLRSFDQFANIVLEGAVERIIVGRGLHSLTSEPNLRTLGNTSLTLEPNLSTFGTQPRVTLGHMGDTASLS